MYPHQMEQLVSQHNEELRTQARRSRRHVPRQAPRNSVRHRAGWTLVAIGLRLAGADHDA
jgi:hypothetical protein